MIIGFLKESDSPVSPIVPGNLNKLNDLFDFVLVESGIADGCAYVDEDFSEGAQVSDRASILSSADVIVQMTPDITDAEYQAAKGTALFIGQYAPFTDENIAKDLTAKKVNVVSLDMIPRTSLAQSMDVLSAMGSIAGYQAVLVGLQHLPRYAPMMITAAGSIKPAKVLILGAGVAGLQAIATARRMGAMVEAFDTRAAVKEEVQSLGAKFVEVEGAADDKDAGGYAVEQSEEYKQRQAALIAERAAQSDIVISTAQLRGRPAPLLIKEETVKGMKRGSVIIDLAASTGGNCEVTKDNETIDYNGVTIVGDSYLPRRMAQDASVLYSNNIFNFLKHIINDGAIDLETDEEILSKSIISKA